MNKKLSNNHPIRSARGPNQFEDNRQQGDVEHKSMVAADDLQNSRSNTHNQS